MTTALQLNHVSAAYGETRVLSDLSLDVAGGELVALLGPSGCGKTTLLKIVAGLLQPSRGDVRFDGEPIDAVPAERRRAAMVFQKPLLFPYLSVADNVAFGLKMRKVAAGERLKRVADALRLVQLEGYETRRPNELSGGQEQRVSLARALVTEPRVLLLDEPFSALDEALRLEMRAFVRGLQRRLKITTVFVTHDQIEAAAMADRIALLLDGRVEQVGSARDYYTAPLTPQAARFFGWQVIAAERHGAVFETSLGTFVLPTTASIEGPTTQAAIAFRPEKLHISRLDVASDTQAENVLEGTIESVIDLGARVRYTVAVPSAGLLDVEQGNFDGFLHSTLFEQGTKVLIHIPADAVRFFGGR